MVAPSNPTAPNATTIKEPPPVLAVAGRTGLRQYNGYLYEEWHPNLQGQRAARTYREMSDNDPIIGAFVYMIEMLIRQVDFRINPNPKRPKSVAAANVAKFVDSARNDMESTFNDFLSEVVTMVIYGWALFEELYKVRRGPNDMLELNSRYNDGLIGWRDFSPRAQDTLQRWEPTPQGRILGMWQSAPPDFVWRFVDLRKAILFRPRSWKQSPEGRSLIRNAYRPWFFVRRMEEIEGIGIERELCGLPVMQVPPAITMPGATDAEKSVYASYQKLVREVKVDGYQGLVIPSEVKADGTPTQYKFSLLNAGGSPKIDVSKTIERHQSRILVSVLSEFLLLGMNKVGSFALGSVKKDMMTLALGALLSSIEDVFNRVAIPRLCFLNGWGPELYPVLQHADIEAPDLATLANYIATIAKVPGLIGKVGPEVVDYLRRYGGLPPEEDDPGAVEEPTPAEAQKIEINPAELYEDETPYTGPLYEHEPDKYPTPSGGAVFNPFGLDSAAAYSEVGAR